MATNLTDASGFLWDVQDNGNILGGTSDAFDGGLGHVGFGTFPTPTLEDAGREVVLGPFASGQVTVTRKIYVPDTGTGFARFLEIVTNTGTTATNYTVGITSNLGSDSGTNVINTSSGDTAFTTADRWIITDDTDAALDPTVVHFFGGAGAGTSPSSVSQNNDVISYNFDLSLNPGETKVIMHFAVQANNQADAAAAAAFIDSNPAAIFSGMSSDELAQLVNFTTPPPVNAIYSIAATASSAQDEGDSGATSFSFTVTRAGDLSTAGSVDYVVAGSGTNAASAGDFAGSALPTGTVNFAANESTKTITVSVAGDTAGESNESFTVTLQNAVGGSVSATAAEAAGNIVNDDLLPLTTGDDLYNGTIGRDLVAGLAGDDMIGVLDGDDGVSAGAGDDQVNGGSGNDTLAGGNGDDFLYGGSGNDLLYGGSAPDWPDDEVQTSSASGVIPSTGQTLAISLTAPTTASGGTVTVEGLVSRSAVQSNQFNIVYVIDRSGSMSNSFQGTETVPDMNGDGSTNTLMDAAISSFESLNASLASTGFGSSLLGIVQFDNTVATIYNGILNVDANSNSLSDAADALRTIRSSGSTYYDLGLQQAIAFFQAAPQGNNVVFFISDGAPNGGPYDDEVATLLDANGINATIRAIGLGTGASLSALDLVDDGVANNSATRVDSPSTLTAGLIAPPVDSADIARVEILKDGVVVATLLPSQLVSTPLGLQFRADVSGLDLDDNTLVARVIATDTDHTTVSSSLTVSAALENNHLYGGSGSDTLVGGIGTDVFDGGSGNDTASFAATGSAVTVDLARTDYQETGGAGLDRFIAIENLVGSAQADTLSGNAVANILNGGAGNDVLWGRAGDDLLIGAGGNDVLTGGEGTDTASYASAAAGVTVDLALVAAQNTLGAGSDTLSEIENLTGSRFGDRLTGEGGNNALNGGDGNDTLNGAAGDDVLNGGNGIDTASYADAGAGVRVNLALTIAQNTLAAGSDRLTGVESVLGSAFADVLIGNAGANTLTGGAGNDLLNGGAGNDVLSGGAGLDTATYATATAGVQVSLAQTAAQNTGGAGSDQLSGIENLVGSNLVDTLTGDTFANLLNGGGGNDRLNGGSGNDTLVGGLGKDTLSGGVGNDIFDFNLPTETGTTNTTWDVVSDFVSGQDKVDLSTLDANTATAANDAFTGFIDSAASFTAAGQLKLSAGVLYGNTDADSTAEFAIQLTGISALTAADVLL